MTPLQPILWNRREPQGPYSQQETDEVLDRPESEHLGNKQISYFI